MLMISMREAVWRTSCSKALIVIPTVIYWCWHQCKRPYLCISLQIGHEQQNGTLPQILLGNLLCSVTDHPACPSAPEELMETIPSLLGYSNWYFSCVHSTTTQVSTLLNSAVAFSNDTTIYRSDISCYNENWNTLWYNAIAMNHKAINLAPHWSSRMSRRDYDLPRTCLFEMMCWFRSTMWKAKQN